MPFLQRERPPLDPTHETDQCYESHLLLYALLLAVSVVMILSGAMLLAAQAAPGQPKPANTCKQTASWAKWETLLEKYPDDLALRKLYDLRIELCAQVEAGKLTMAEGTERFEQARRALMQQAERPRAEVPSQHEPEND